MSVDIDGLLDGGTFTPTSVLEGQTGGVSGKHTGTQMWDGLRDLSCLEKYTVGATGCAYTTITAAIAAAVGDGATEVDQKLILVVPGIYTESFTVPSGIFVLGLPGQRSFAVHINGTVTINAPPLVGPKGFCGLVGLTVVGAAAGALVVTGTGAQNAYLDECSLTATTTADTVIINNTAASSLVDIQTSRISTSGTGRCVLAAAPGLAEFITTSFDHGASGGDSTAIEITAGTVSTASGEINGRILVGAGGTLNMGQDSFPPASGTLSSVDIAAGGVATVGQVFFTTTASPTITGAAGAVFVYTNLYWDPTGVGGGIDGTMGAGIIPLRTEVEVEYTPGVAGDWVGPVPTNVTAAVDRLASAVAGLLAAPVP